MLKAVSPKGNVYKAIKGTEFVNIIENNRTKFYYRKEGEQSVLLLRQSEGIASI